MTADERQRLNQHLDGFDLQLVDLVRSDEADVRMGTFVQAAAFIDALARAYTWHLPKKAIPGGDAGQWRRFVRECFPADHSPLAEQYGGFRCLLLHNFSASPDLAFTSSEPLRHLMREGSGRLVLDRGSFVAATEQAFQTFREKVLADDELAQRVLDWLDQHPTISYWTPDPSAAAGAVALSGASYAGSRVAAVAAMTGVSRGTVPSGVTGMNRSPDRPYAQMASSVKSKKRKKPGSR